MTNDSIGDLFPEVHNPANLRVINERCGIRTQDGHCVVLVSGMPLAQYALGDRMSEALAMVNLVDQGWADQNDVANAFGCSVRTLRRHQRRFEEGGLAALGRTGGYPRGRPRLSSMREQSIQQLKARGHSQNEIARCLGVTVRAVRKTLRRLGWKPQTPVQTELPLQSSQSARPDPSDRSAAPGSLGASAPAPERGEDPNLSAFAKTQVQASTPASLDTDPTDRSLDRLLARLGLLDDAPPLFGCVSALPRAGVLLAIPALVQSGVFEGARQVYGSLGPAFYGLRTTVLTLLLMALWRIKRPEALKEHAPAALGWVMGIDRAPEVKTLRRKLARLALLQRAAQFGQALAQRRIAGHGQAFGFLYVDGHVRVYHGRHRLPKAHVARMRLSLPATTDYWVNDPTGDPLFVVTAAANAGLVKMLPGILEQVRRLVGKRRLTVVFDRGGYSFKLFRQVLAAGFDLLTYRKGPWRPIPRKRFHPCQTRLGGKTTTCLLADQEVRLQAGKLRLRQITRLAEDGHQTPILTSRRDLSAAQVAYRMFARWRQENFFKYLREEYALDALADHQVVSDDPNREVPNPEWAAVDAQLRQAQARLDRLQAEYGLEALTDLDKQRRTLRGFRIAQSKLSRQIWDAWQAVEQLQARRRKIPRRVPVQSISSEPVVKLAPEIKHLTNLIKMVAYQAESELLRAVAPHYARASEEGRTLIQSALSNTADLAVTQTELVVTLAPLSSAHRTRAIAALCEELNASETTFPGSCLRLRYAIRQPA